jgi:TonB-linked SusC/RagA family outer membrane protein
MKKQHVLLLFLLVLFGKTAISQTITLSVKNASLEKVFTEIKKQTGYSFIYSKNSLINSHPVDINVKDANINQVLQICLSNQRLTYTITDKYITIRSVQSENIPLQTNAHGLSRNLSGIVTGEDGSPLTGAFVRVRGNGKGVVVNIHGNFLLQDVLPKSTIVISYVGYQTAEINPEGNTNISVQMQPSVEDLDATVVIGYGTTTRRKNTGSVSSITASDIAKQTINNPLTALQGRIPGMQITQDNGLMGGAVRVNIRGAGSGISSAGFIPLYVIDGVPFTLFNGGSPASDNLNAYGTSGANGNLSPFAMINPEDIERIDVLKDADATAIYGSRGSNGVVLITTKKGSRKGTVFNFNVNHGSGKVAHFIDMMNTQQYLTMRKEAFTNAGITPTATNALDLTTWDQNAYTDWQRFAIGGTSDVTNATASISGSDDQNSFLFSSTYRNEGTVFPGNYNNTNFSTRLNAGHTSIDRKFNINLSVNYAYMRNNLPTTDISNIYNLAPNFPLYNANGTANWTSTNPLSYFKKNYAGTTTNLVSNLDLSYKILPGLTAKANLGYTTTRLQQTSTNPASSQNPAGSTTSRLIYADNNNDNYIIEPQINYNKTFGQGKLDVLAGTTFQQNKSTGVYLNGVGYTNEALITSLLAASSITASYNNYSLYKYTAFFGRINYSWADKYIVDATARRDGSSRFGPGKRFGNFGAVGAAWIFTKEKFASSLNFLSYGKLRGSYGLTGNDQIPDYLYTTLYGVTSSSYAYQGTTSYSLSNISNPNLHWETTKKLDIALELGFLHDRILLKTDFYSNRTSDQLIYIATPSQSGVNGYYGNFPADVQNKGWEFELNTTNIKTNDFKWSTSINLTINRNKLISYPDLATSSYASSYVIGQPTDIRFMYHFTGVDPATGLPTFEDLNKDGLITYANDRKPVPYGHPYYGGLINTLSYKGFVLDFAFQYNHRNGYIDNGLSNNPFGYTYENQPISALNRWKQAGDIAKLPAATTTSSASYSNLIYSSDYNWGDASYLKLKTVSLNYNFSRILAKKVKMSAISIYVQGQNLYTWAKQKNTYDPEVTRPGTGSGLGTGQYITLPQLRTIIIGINGTF